MVVVVAFYRPLLEAEEQLAEWSSGASNRAPVRRAERHNCLLLHRFQSWYGSGSGPPALRAGKHQKRLMTVHNLEALLPQYRVARIVGGRPSSCAS